MYGVMTVQDPVPVQKAWSRFVKHLDKRAETALRSSVKSALTELQRSICGDPTNKDHEITVGIINGFAGTITAVSRAAAVPPQSGVGRHGY
jgi:hypothetical protein